MASKSKEIADEYVSSLSDLTINSKPLINMLTMLAEDNMEHAPAIVEAVENHLQKVRSDIKLPVLYLIDSIVKNVNGAYLSLFTQNIVNTFCGVFEKVDENTRASMWKLRQTWNDVFPAKKLFTLDVRVNGIDPAWPITPITSSGSIHVNPRFLPRPQAQATPAPTPAIVPSVKLPLGEPVTKSEAVMREQLLKKQKELLELQKKKIELELLQAKASLEQQQRQLDKQVSTVKPEMPLTTANVTKSAETVSQPKTVPAVPNETSKTPSKQFPAATASLLKNVGTNNGPRIAPASSIAVASARPVSRDPRIKSSSSQESSPTHTDLQRTPVTQSDSTRDYQPQLTSNLNSVLSEQLKQQLMLKQAVNSDINKPSVNTAGSVSPVSNISNFNPNININKAFSGNSNKDATSHRVSQKKDPRTSISTSSNLSSSKTINHGSNTSASSSRGSGEKSKSSSRNFSTEKSASSKSSHRKVGNKSRSKQPQTIPTKIAKIDRDASPIRSKSREKDSDDSSPSSRISPQSSSQSKSRKKNNKSRKRTPSPPYRIPRRSDAKPSSNSGGLTEEEQSGSLIVSPPHPPTFKEIRPNARQRNYVRRNKDGSLSPDVSSHTSSQVLDQNLEASSKDEDLRAPLPVSSTTIGVTEKKEDLDLRILPPVNPNKRHSNEHLESSKKSKSEKFDALFGNEDVDLRTLTHPKAGRPPTPPPPVISGENSKDSWAKIKTSPKSDRENKANADEKRDRDRNRDRLGRLRLFNKTPDDAKDRRRSLPNENQDPRSNRRGGRDDKPDRNEDRNIEIIMKQAAEQLNQGSITKTQYNTLIQEVLHMSEDRKLKAAQRKEKETGSIVWEKGLEIDQKSPFESNEEMVRNKDHIIARNPNGPRWQNQAWQQQPGPWAHPPGPFGPQSHFTTDFRGVSPWQNSRHYGPIRPDYPYHSGFNHNMGPNPRMGHSMMGPIGPNGPIISNLMPNGPVGPMTMTNPSIPLSGINGPGMLINNGPINSMITSANTSFSGRSYNVDEAETDYSRKHDSNMFNRELPPPDPKLLEEISLDTMKSINIDNIPREIRYYGETGVVFMHWNDPREIGFQDGIRRILIDDKETIVCAFNDPYKEFKFNGEIHRIKLGAPTRELYVDGRWYECYFGGMAVMVDINGKKVSIKLEGPPPQVKIGSVKRTDLVIAKINLIINARNMVPVFLDAKPQMFEIEGTPFTLEFIDALQTVLINGRPFKVEFGGLPKPIHIRDKKHFIRFSILPRNVRPGYVKIKGMRGEQAKDSSPTPSLSQQKLKIGSTSTFSMIEPESTSQDGSDLATGAKSDLQLDMLSSVLPSAMAPASGLSYQAEPRKSPPAPATLSLTELFQRLVETGIVPSLSEQKKQEEDKKEPDVIPVSFDKPETLKTKQPATVSCLYNGIQCSSCGTRFAPENASYYSRHLDWHFRQNRREKDSARKAHSRTWYYDLNDWIQYEEIEDMEERAQNWFETEKQSAENDGSPRDSPREATPPSVPTGSDKDNVCRVCHDAFEQFFNEEKEEWHLKPAVSFEGKNYHPLCLEDHKQSLEKKGELLDESFADNEDGKDDSLDANVQDPEPQETNFIESDKHIDVSKDDVAMKDEIFNPTDSSTEEAETFCNTGSMEISDIYLTPDNHSTPEKHPPLENPVKTSEYQIRLDDIGTSEVEKASIDQSISEIQGTSVNEEPMEDQETFEAQETSEIKEPSEVDKTLEHQNIVEDTMTTQQDHSELEQTNNTEEPEIEEIEVAQAEPIVVTITEDQQETTELNESQVNVSSQSVDKTENDETRQEEERFDFTKVKIKEEPIDPEAEFEEAIVPKLATADTTYTDIKSTIDGNVELDAPTPATLFTIPSRIKINITKPLISREPESVRRKQKSVDDSIEEVERVLVPASVKPGIKNKKLSNLPPIEKGEELSGLCTIM